MRILYTFLFLLGFSTAATAAAGDTTWVQANNVQLNYYNDFDTTVVFPNGSKTYRKIYMIFTLGKYVCPGNPQYCGDWDYTVQNFFMAKNASDTLELGRLITPYAHTGYGPFTANWTRRYIFDVTDYYPALRDTGTVRIHYSGYSGGFTGNIRFAFIEGTPERNVARIDRIWHGDFKYGHGSVPINTALGTIAKTVPSGAQSASVKMNLTAHGGDDNACAEFCPNVYTMNYNGATLAAQQAFFRSDCSMNDLYPQSGTWIYARANWCPGDIVKTITHPLTTGLTAANYSLGLSFPSNYTSVTSSGNSPASYTIDGAVVFYSAANRTIDAGIEDIIAPTNAEYYRRENPSTMKPRLKLRNSGSTAISSIEFEYGVVGKAPQTYTWQGNIASFQNAEVSLPNLTDLQLPSGSYSFSVKVKKVNGNTGDGDSLNNAMTSSFTAAPEWPSALAVQLRGNGEAQSGNSALSQTSWIVYDALGNIAAQKLDCGVSALCVDTVRLQPGAYRLVVADAAVLGFYDIPTGGVVGVTQGTGLSGFSSASGYLRVNNAVTGLPITLPGYYNGNFGGGFTQYFYVRNTAGVTPVMNADARLQTNPNPASGSVTISLTGLTRVSGTLSVFDALGRPVHAGPMNNVSIDISLRGWAAGYYTAIFTDAATGARIKTPFIVAQ